MSSATLASEYATDTMGLVLRIEQRRLGSTAKALFEAMETGAATIHVPAIVFAEILYLSEKKRISLTLRSVEEYLVRFPNCREFPLSIGVIRAAAEISDIPELHDRLIAATARVCNVELITNDPIIQASAFIRTVW
jgi:predicted nucleic acid-binding protein